MVAGGGHAWLLGDMHGCGGGGMHGCQGVGVCMVARGHAWLLGGMRGCWGAFMVAGGMHGCRGTYMGAGGHVWLLSGMCGSWGACIVVGGMRGTQRDTVNEQAVRILLECILIINRIIGGICRHFQTLTLMNKFVTKSVGTLFTLRR